MSGYLNRLIQRTQAANASQSLRPFVRSASPIAEYDQRLGVAGFAGAEKGVSPLADGGTDLDTDLDWGQAAADPALMTPDITALSDTTVQRKIAGSNTPTTSMASNPSSTSVLGTSDRPSAAVGADRNSPLGLSKEAQPDPLTLVSRESGQGDRPKASTVSFSSPMTGKTGSQLSDTQRDRPIDSAEQQPPLRPTLRPSTVPAIAIETNRIEGAEPLLGIPLLDMPNSSRPSVVEEETKPNTLRPESSLTRSQSTVPRLEPSTQRLTDRDEQWLDGSPAPTLDRTNSPQVVIGRITVEVIPPPPIASTTAPSRSSPLTAALVSVIGPLGGGVSSHLRLSLRQR